MWYRIDDTVMAAILPSVSSVGGPGEGAVIIGWERLWAQEKEP